jgi:hypothetical protein
VELPDDDRNVETCRSTDYTKNVFTFVILILLLLVMIKIVWLSCSIISWFSSCPPDKCLDTTSVGRNRYLTKPFQFILFIEFLFCITGRIMKETPVTLKGSHYFRII